jgi:protein phosphatase PTC6
MTVVRIPLRSAKHHFGAFTSRCQRPYNEDAWQAGTIELPAFAPRRPESRSITRRKASDDDESSNAADKVTGDPQVFYFGIFDGHGGAACSEFLRDRLASYVEESARSFELTSTLHGPAIQAKKKNMPTSVSGAETWESGNGNQTESAGKRAALEQALVKAWRELVGGYFRRFKPEYFSTNGGGIGAKAVPQETRGGELTESRSNFAANLPVPGIENVLEYAFLKADYDFIAAQAGKSKSEGTAINAQEILGRPSQLNNIIGGPDVFLGGSTCSIALISTPTPVPYWNSGANSTIVTAHVGDTRILLCDVATGNAVPLTTTHHPDHPVEAQRMRRYAATFTTDSFGEERVQGLANTRSFGDMPSKRIGVSAEPQVTRVEVNAAQYAFMVLMSDGVTNTLGDQEVVDIVKESRTPEQGAKEIIGFTTETTEDGDNATVMVVRLGGWERRNEGGGGSLRTKEMRDFRRQEASDPRSRQR